jgi:Flp pilus assembly protein TadD
MGMSKESIRVLRKGKYLHPESASIHSNLGRAYARNSKMDLANVEFKIAEKLIKNEADELIFNYTKAHYYALNEEKVKMIEHLTKAKVLNKEIVIEKVMLDDEFNSFKDDGAFLKLMEK